MHMVWIGLSSFRGICFHQMGFFLLLSFQKYRVDMPGSSSAFIPTINAITTSQDLQWMVQPTVITSMSNPYSRSHPYGLSVPSGPSLLGHTALTRPGVIRSIGDARGRRKRDEQVCALFCLNFKKRVVILFFKHIEQCSVLYLINRRQEPFLYSSLSLCIQLTPEEEEKRRVRRERNKLAAAKCRNRRRELTEMLQGVSVAIWKPYSPYTVKENIPYIKCLQWNLFGLCLYDVWIPQKLDPIWSSSAFWSV